MQVSNVCLTYFIWFSVAYVSIKILSSLWTVIRIYILPICRGAINFKQYGQWAVITGCTDGIGKEFAKELASKGVDICLISRSEEKLKNTAKEIEDNYAVETKYIVADFSYSDVYDNIRKNLDGMDVGILVNNVGVMAEPFAPFSDREEQLIRGHININILTLTMMTHIVLPGMKAKKRGLIINMSSLLDDLPLSLLTIYCSTKAYTTMFGKCVSQDLKKHNIQMTTICAGFVLTKLALQYSKITSLVSKICPFFVITTNRFVNSTFVTLRSGSNINCGFIGYHIYGAIARYLPICLLEKLAKFIENY